MVKLKKFQDSNLKSIKDKSNKIIWLMYTKVYNKTLYWAILNQNTQEPTAVENVLSSSRS